MDKVEFSTTETFPTFECPECEREFLIFSIIRGTNDYGEDFVNWGCFVRGHCPMCGHKVTHKESER